MLKFSLATSALALLAISAHAQSYDFESLSSGTLSGQDGWTDLSAYGIPSPTVGAGTGVDATNVVKGPATGPSVGIHARGVASDADHDAALQMDARLDGGGNTVLFGMANADDADPFAVGLDSTQGGAAFLFYRRSDLAPTKVYSPAVYATWFRMRVLVDYAANGGDGSASVFYQDLTAGGTAFLPVANMQNLDLGLTASNLSTNRMADWTNVQVRVDATAQADNLYVGPVPVPEPGTWAALGLGVIALIRRRKRL